MTHTAAIIPARGGSKGIPRKNLLNFCGRPLLYWSIRQALDAQNIDSVWVSSDDQEILDVASSCGARPILRPENISHDTASSEAAWLHAMQHIQGLSIDLDTIVALQATSPIRQSNDLDKAYTKFKAEGYDSLFSVNLIRDFHVWALDGDGFGTSVNYDYTKRKPRQKILPSYLENGSFYIFSPSLLEVTRNRIGGKIGFYVMEPHKMFQIDELQDVRLCEVIMHGYGLA